jgi:predicted protein tyrosine phosphatase
VELVHVAVLAATDGRGDELGWPAVDDLVPRYLRVEAISGFAAPLPDDPGVILADALGAERTRADVALSLCRMGRSGLPAAGEHHEVMLADSPDPEANPNLEFLLDQIVDAIAEWRRDGRTVVVHCAAAISRSPTVTALYLARHLGIDGMSALERVRAIRPEAEPNARFMQLLASTG